MVRTNSHAYTQKSINLHNTLYQAKIITLFRVCPRLPRLPPGFIPDYLRGVVVASRPVAMGAYTMDSHHVRRCATADGVVRNEGNIEVSRNKDGSRFPPYPIDYGAVIPRREECFNLFVPVCMSASHIAFGSIRMEPVFFALGQVAGTAAALAVECGVPVQDIPYGKLVERLQTDGQVLSLP